MVLGTRSGEPCPEVSTSASVSGDPEDEADKGCFAEAEAYVQNLGHFFLLTEVFAGLGFGTRFLGVC